MPTTMNPSPNMDVGFSRVMGAILGLYAATIGVRVSILGLHPQSLIPLVALAYLLVYAPKNRQYIRWGLLELAAVVYIIIRTATEIFNSVSTDHSANMAVASNVCWYFLVFLLARSAVQNRSQLRAFLGTFAAWSAPVALIAVAQVALGSSVTSGLLKFTSSSGAAGRLEDDRMTRSTSLIGHWSALGGYLCVSLAMLFVILILRREDRGDGIRHWTTQPKWVISAIVIACAGIVSTFTVAPILIAILVLAVVATIFRPSPRVVIAGVAIGFLIVWYFLPSIQSRLAVQTRYTTYLSAEYDWVPSTVAVRIDLWINESWPAFSERPWTGWGQSVFGQSGYWPERPTSIVWPYPESEIAKAMVTSGVIGMLALAFLLGVWLIVMRRSRVVLGSGVSLVASALLIGLIVGSFINPYFTNQGVPGALWALMGALAFTAGHKPPSDLRPNVRPKSQLRNRS